MEFLRSKEKQYSVLTVKGDIRTSEAPALKDAIATELSQNSHLIIDFSNVEYICSAGLRALLAGQQMVDDMNDAELQIRKVNNEVMSVFRATGFVNVFTIK